MNQVSTHGKKDRDKCPNLFDLACAFHRLFQDLGRKSQMKSKRIGNHLFQLGQEAIKSMSYHNPSLLAFLHY